MHFADLPLLLFLKDYICIMYGNRKPIRRIVDKIQNTLMLPFACLHATTLVLCRTTFSFLTYKAGVLGANLRRQVDTVTSTLSCQTPWLGPRFFIQSRRHRQLHVSRPLGGRLPMYA